MENQIFVDRRLFPQVTEITMLDAAPFLEARMRDGEGPNTVRLDMYSVSYDGESVFGTEDTHIIGRGLPKEYGQTLLRQRLGQWKSAFTHIILDPAIPDVVTLIGPATVPKFGPESQFKLIPLDELLARENLTNVTRMALASMDYANRFDPYAFGDRVHALPLGWEVECITLAGQRPAFYLRQKPTAD